MTTNQIPITNGKGSKELINGNYNVTAEINGYDNSSLDPTQITIDDATQEFKFTIAANGTLTLNVLDEESVGIPIENASFYRCDSSGNAYGDVITSDVDGNAVFNNVPFSADGNIVVYYKQVDSDGSHTFDDTLKQIVLTEETTTVEVVNPEAELKTFIITDKNYADLPVSDGILNLERENN